MRLRVALRAAELAGVAGWLLLSVGACASTNPPPRTAADVVRDFARALSDGDADRAYALMAPEYRQRVSLIDWQKRFQENPEEVAEAGARLSHVRSAGSSEHPLANAGGARVLERDGRFYLASEEIEFYDQSSPRAALRSFVAAFTRRRYDVVLRLTPEADKEGVTTDSLALSYGHGVRAELERLLTQLRAHLDDPIEIEGARAVMPYAGHKRASLVLEGGRWRVEQPE